MSNIGQWANHPQYKPQPGRAGVRVGAAITYQFQPLPPGETVERTGIVTSVDGEGFLSVTSGGRTLWGVFEENGVYYAGSAAHARLKARMAANAPLEAKRPADPPKWQKTLKRLRVDAVTWLVNTRAAWRRRRRK
jgi:hypothetical protein